MHRHGERVDVARDFLEAGSDFHGAYHYATPDRLHANDGAFSNEYWAWQGRRLQVRRLAARGGCATALELIASPPLTARGRLFATQLSLDPIDTGEPEVAAVNITSNVTVLEDLPPEWYEFVTEVGGVCEKISFSFNTTAPVPILFRYSVTHLFRYSVTHLFRYSVTHLFRYTPIPLFRSACTPPHGLLLPVGPLDLRRAEQGVTWWLVQGAAVKVRYEDDQHFPVDKVVGAGSQDTEPSMRGCSGEHQRPPAHSAALSVPARRIWESLGIPAPSLRDGFCQWACQWAGAAPATPGIPHSVGSLPNCLDKGLPVRTWRLRGLYAKIRARLYQECRHSFTCQCKSDRVRWPSQ